MNYRKSFLFILLVVYCLFVSSCGGVTTINGNKEDGTTEPSKPINEGAAHIVGRCLDSNDNPLEGVKVILIRKSDEGRIISQTYKDGSFEFKNISQGEYIVVASDMKGNGSIIEVNILGGGKTTLKDLIILPFEKIPQAYRIKDIWFEERITETSGDHYYPRYSKNSEFGISFVKLPGETKYKLTKTSLSDGSESVIAESEELDTSLSSPFLDTSNGVLSEGIVGDKYILYWAYRIDEDDNNMKSLHIVVRNLVNGKSGVVPMKPRSNFYHPQETYQDCQYDPYSQTQICTTYEIEKRKWILSYFVSDDRLYYFIQISQKVFKSQNQSFGEYLGSMVEFCYYDLDSFENRCIPTTRNDDYTAFNRKFLYTNGYAVFQTDTVRCDTKVGYCDSDASGGINFIDISNMSLGRCEEVGYDPIAGEEDGYVYYTTQDNGAIPSRFVRCDLKSGKIEDLYSSEIGDGGDLRYSRFSPDYNKVILSDTNNYGVDNFIVFDLKNNSSKIYRNILQFNGKEYPKFFDVCYFNNCFDYAGKEYIASKIVSRDAYKSIFGVDMPEGKDVLYFILHIPLDGRDSYVTIEDIYSYDTGYVDYSKQIEKSNDGRYIAENKRLETTGFSQIFVTDTQNKSTMQITFINAQHRYLRWSNDSRHIVYLARDPISGYEQFFRVNAGSFFTGIEDGNR